MRLRERQAVNTKTMKIVYGGLLIALGILLPQVFHIFGQNAGMMFLPIQIPVLMAGILLGPYYGLAVGLVVPILSCMLTGMPPVPKVYFMIAELGTYGVVSGMLSKKAPVYVSLLAAMVSGRIVYGLALVAGVYILHMNAPFMNQTAFVSGIVTGIPGILIQLSVIPLLYYALKKGGLIFEE